MTVCSRVMTHNVTTYGLFHYVVSYKKNTPPKYVFRLKNIDSVYILEKKSLEREKRKVFTDEYP